MTVMIVLLSSGGAAAQKRDVDKAARNYILVEKVTVITGLGRDYVDSEIGRFKLAPKVRFISFQGSELSAREVQIPCRAEIVVKYFNQEGLEPLVEQIKVLSKVRPE